MLSDLSPFVLLDEIWVLQVFEQNVGRQLILKCVDTVSAPPDTRQGQSLGIELLIADQVKR